MTIMGFRKPWCYLIICAIVILLPATVWSNTQMPKIFININPVQVIDPLQKGFQIVLKNDFIDHYLHPGRMPTLFLSAIPMDSRIAAKRLMYLREDLNGNLLILNGLEMKTWYFVCVEFENVIRKENRGNMTTKCELIRTLDDFGKEGESVISDVRIREVGESFMTFELAVESHGSLQLMAYLESGSCPVQTYLLDRPHSLRIHFPNLSPGFNYDRLCIIYRPLLDSYTMMGRTVHMTKTECHFGGLETKIETPGFKFMADDANSKSLEAQSLKLKEPRSLSSSAQPSYFEGSKTSFKIIAVCILLCLLFNIALPAIPLTYLLVFSQPKSRIKSFSQSDEIAVKSCSTVVAKTFGIESPEHVAATNGRKCYSYSQGLSCATDSPLRGFCVNDSKISRRKSGNSGGCYDEISQVSRPGTAFTPLSDYRRYSTTSGVRV